MISVYASKFLNSSRSVLRLAGGAQIGASCHHGIYLPSSKTLTTKRFYVTDEQKNTLAIDISKVLDVEPIQRTPQTAFFIPNMFTHRFLPTEESLKNLSNNELSNEVFRIRDLPLTVDLNHAGKSLIDKNGLPSHKHVQKGFFERDVSEYELYLEEFQVELNKYKQSYLSRLNSSLQGIDILNLPTDIQALVPPHLKKTANQLKLERIEARRSKVIFEENEAKKKSKAASGTQDEEEVEMEEEEDESTDEVSTTTADGVIASRTNLRLSYKDTYRVPRMSFENLRKDLQLLKLMDNDNSAHRKYMIQCNLDIASKHEVISHSMLSKSNMQMDQSEPPKSLARLKASSKNNSAFLPLENAGIQVNFSSISKAYLQTLIKSRGRNEDFMTIIDVRSRVRAFDCRIPGAVNIPLREILKGALKLGNEEFQSLYGIPKIPTRHTLIFYADHEQDAIMASALTFLNNGYRNVLVYKGGVADWFGYGFQPMWARYKNTEAKSLSREEWLQFYGRNRHHITQDARKTAMLNRFIAERLPEDLKTLRMLNSYAAQRMSYESKNNDSEYRLPFIGHLDLHDGVPAKLLFDLTKEKIHQLRLSLNPAHPALNASYNYQKYYGPQSQKTQL